MKVTLGGQVLDTKQLVPIGIGGEAEVFKTPHGTALKVFKDSTHVDYDNNPHEQQGAIERLKRHQKKLPLFPKGLPGSVIAPLALAHDAKKVIRGYEMRYLDKTERLWAYSQPTVLTSMVSGGMVLQLFREMHATILELHKKGIVIGDFNDLNILVENHTKPWFIDADSYQFGGFDALTYDERFVDPLHCMVAKPDTHPALCANGQARMVMNQKHSETSDWFSFAVMLLQSLILAHPYRGGVYRPTGKNMLPIPESMRPISKITVFHKDVIYPKKARPYKILPDDLLQYFTNVFEKDARGMFPLALLQNTRFTTCTSCGMTHARPTCPACNTLSSDHLVTERVTGNVTAKKMFTTSGVILKVSVEPDGLKVLSYENDTYVREGGKVIATAPLRSQKYRISGERTLMATDSEITILGLGGSKERLFADVAYNIPAFDTTSDHVVWVERGRLYRDKVILGTLAPETIGDALPNQTLVWTGEEYGFGFYRAGDIQRFFMFDPNEHRGIKDDIPLPPIRGQMIDATCAFSGKAIWFFVSTREGSERRNKAYMISLDGKIMAEEEAFVDDGSWLGSIRGACGIGTLLFVPTDEGIVRVEARNGRLFPVKAFEHTKAFVDAGSSLFPGTGCILSQKGKTIWKLTIA